MIQVFRNKSIGGAIAVIFLCIIAHAHFLFTPVQINATDYDGVLSIVLKKYFSVLNGAVIFIIYITLLLLQAILLNLVLNNLKMFKTKSYVIAMAYILLSAVIPQWHNLSTGFIANTFGIWLFYSLSRLYNNKSVKTLLFNVGLLTAIISLLYFPFISLFIFSFFALAILRPFNIKEWIIFLMGYLTPVYFLFSYLFLTDNLHYNFIKEYLPAISFSNIRFPVTDKFTLIKLAFCLLVFIISLFQLSTVKIQAPIQVRRYWNLMFIYLLLVTAVPFIFTYLGIEAFIICIIPLASFIANLFALPKKNVWLINLLFLIFIVIIAHTNWMLINI